MINYKFILDGEVKELNAKHEGIFIKEFRKSYPDKGHLKKSDLNIIIKHHE